MEKKCRSQIVAFIVALESHMEMDFGYKGRDFHINFTSDETNSVEVFEISEGPEQAFSEEYESIEKLFQSCFIDGNSFEEILFNFDYIYAITLVGKKKMNIYYKDKVYQLFYDDRLNLIKYMHLFYIIKNRKEGIENGFIGI